MNLNERVCMMVAVFAANNPTPVGRKEIALIDECIRIARAVDCRVGEVLAAERVEADRHEYLSHRHLFPSGPLRDSADRRHGVEHIVHSVAE